MAKMREKMPLYATDNSFTISGEQLERIVRGRQIFKNDSSNYDHIRKRAGYRITQLKDGTWWVENYRAGAPLFAPDYWHSLPTVQGERAKKLYEFSLTL